MYQLKTKANYKSKLSMLDTEIAIKVFKDELEHTLARELNLTRVTAPLLVPGDSGINDDLSGIERIVRFDVKEIPDYSAEIVQSLAKWKRVALTRYGFSVGAGLYTDMNAVRRDDDIDNIHSIFVDQWDWELVIERKDRCIDFLKAIVQKIMIAIVEAQIEVQNVFPIFTKLIDIMPFFVTSQELLNMYPNMTAHEREQVITKRKGTVFIMQIGDELSDGTKHGSRAPDYDDWELNGDLLIWSDNLDMAIEVSSMGIRVDESSLDEQLKKANKEERKKFDYHKAILNSELPLTIGGGIGQSRLCLLVLEKMHVGEVQASLWPKEMIEECSLAGINLL